ncbi:uncharacterized metal-binding protein YceD (DUF177 family) [Rhodovulum bhavnagarense]|uniref:Uncharacterized metal-binding protein YceD (DUF177 family) n=1 Tax=Rhodovulum bhavnagarense TaxID=992286 RepID=A0A4R2RGW3_9RHOB|nr:DUF177 domain-containing protein [Rhodovulum bhavnagarense]TCP61994.1 uncharacterized metal-binding protein YceD (DUF177 family) [Rhodovulum bhavnagarense]
MPARQKTDTPIHPRRLPARAAVEIVVEPDAPARAALAERLGLIALRKLRLAGRLVPEGRRDWRLEASLGATVVQPCVVTLAPVTTRIDAPVIRTYRAEMPPLPEGDEIEMPDDETEEPLPETIDPTQVMEEALALALPLYPRTEGAELAETVIGPPGVAPLTDETAKPFAGLAALKKKLDD